MSFGTKTRLIVTLLVLALGLFLVWRANLEPARVSLLLTAAICAATALYALLTYEILLQNQSMAKAAADSAVSMERGLRFSYASSLLYRTFNTKDASLQNRKDCTPFNDDDYKSALSEYSQNKEQMEYVFCEVLNVGRGAATSLTIRAEYTVQDASNSTKRYTVNKEAVVQLLEPDKSVALFICLFKIPTQGDRAKLVRASMNASDSYRDALKEPPLIVNVGSQDHHFEPEAGCIVRLS